jgi:Tfp pilus assembly protein PilV
MHGGVVSRVSERGARGSTLLEVAIALGIMAMCGLGLMSTQLALVRHAQLAAARERAAFAADAMAEAARVAGATPATTDRWNLLAASVVPEGRLTTSSAGGDASIGSVSWAAIPLGAASASTAVSRIVPCLDATAPAGRACVALSFLR